MGFASVIITHRDEPEETGGISHPLGSGELLDFPLSTVAISMSFA